MELIRNRTLSGNTENADLKLVPKMINTDKLNIKNQRPRDYLEEREAYEQLCRQTESKVKKNFHKN